MHDRITDPAHQMYNAPIAVIAEATVYEGHKKTPKPRKRGGYCVEESPQQYPRAQKTETGQDTEQGQAPTLPFLPINSIKSKCIRSSSGC